MNPQQNLGLQLCVETVDGKFARFIIRQINVRLLELREGHKVTQRQSKNIRVWLMISVDFCCSPTRKDRKSTKEQLTGLELHLKAVMNW